MTIDRPVYVELFPSNNGSNREGAEREAPCRLLEAHYVYRRSHEVFDVPA